MRKLSRVSLPASIGAPIEKVEGGQQYNVRTFTSAPIHALRAITRELPEHVFQVVSHLALFDHLLPWWTTPAQSVQGKSCCPKC